MVFFMIVPQYVCYEKIHKHAKQKKLHLYFPILSE